MITKKNVKKFLVKCLLKIFEEIALLTLGLILWSIGFAGITPFIYYNEEFQPNEIFFGYIFGYTILYILTLHFMKWFIRLDVSKPYQASDSVSPQTQEDIEWERLWDEIYDFQKHIPVDYFLNDEEERERMEFYITYGKYGEPLIINKELDSRLFRYRCSH